MLSLALHTPKIHLVSRLCAQQVPDAEGTWSGCPAPGRAQLSPGNACQGFESVQVCQVEPKLWHWLPSTESPQWSHPTTSAAGSQTDKCGHGIPQGSAVAKLQMSALLKKRLCTAMPPMASGVTNSTYCYKNSHQSVSKYCLRDPFENPKELL